MELKVWVEGMQRIVCGVTDTTTCQDVVLALAHATGKVGRFTLTERWRNNERLLSPQEFPLKILMKWGEYSNDIQLILRQSDTGRKKNASLHTDNPRCCIGYGEPPPPYRYPPSAHVQVRQAPNRSRGQSSHMPPVTISPSESDMERNPELVTYNSQYQELVSRVNYQRETLSSQQVNLIKYDAEIRYWETKGREQERQIELLQQQMSLADEQLRISTEQVNALLYIEEESETVKKKEKALRSEIMMLRSKLASWENELQQMRGKVRCLMNAILAEQRLLSARNQENRKYIERSMLTEAENLQSQIEHAKHATEFNHLTAEKLKCEVGVLETAIMEKKRQVERLVQQMKEANLHSLAGSVDELRHSLDGMYKSGSARRIIGSPRQLETAAPTNKNPHGVWV